MIEIINDIKKLNKFKILIIYIAIALLFFSIGELISYSKNKNLIMDDSVYDLIRSAKDNNRYDEISSRNWNDISHIYLKPFLILGDQFGVIIAELTLLIVAVVALFFIIKEEIMLMTLCLISPFFINNYLIFSDFTIVLTLLIMISSLYVSEKKYYAIPLIAIISYIHPIAGFIVILYSIFDTIWKKDKSFIPLFYAIIFIPSSILGIIANKSLLFPNNILFSLKENLIFEFGAVKGLPILIIIVGIIGVYQFYKETPAMLYCFILGLIAIPFDKNIVFVLIGASLIFYTWRIIEFLIRKKWELEGIKTISIYMVFCGIIFSFVAGANMIAVHKFDNPKLMGGLNWIKTNSQDADVVLIDPRFSNKVEYVIGKSVFPLDEIKKGENQNQISEDYLKLIHSRNIDESKEILNRYNVTYIVITPDIRTDFMLKSNSDGILFVVESYSNFREVYHNELVNIYRYYSNRI